MTWYLVKHRMPSLCGA